MKTIRSLMRHYYMARVGIFLITVALIAGMVGCGGGGADGGEVESYTLTIDSTAGGVVTVNNVTIPGKAIFTYDAGTVVNLNATPDSDYQFVNWTGDVGTIDNVYASETIITMNGNYLIMASFEVPPPVQYSLTIYATAGGSVTTPGEGRFIRESGMVVNLVATSASGYQFAKWTGNVDTIANVNAASTNIIISGNYYICAKFRETPVVCTSLGFHTVGLNWDGSGVALGCNCSPPSTPSYPPGDNCFIATAAYGTPMAEEIQILREFRDKYLLTNLPGRAFIDFYYRVSPPIAEFITEHPSLKPIVRVGLMPAVVMSTIVVNTTLAGRATIAGLLVLLSVAVAVWVTKRLGRGPEYP